MAGQAVLVTRVRQHARPLRAFASGKFLLDVPNAQKSSLEKARGEIMLRSRIAAS